MTAPFPGLTDIHAHPAMNAFLWDRNLCKHYFTRNTFCPLASLTDFKMLKEGGVKVLWSSLHVPEPQYFRAPPLWLAAHITKGGRTLLKQNAWVCLQRQKEVMEQQVGKTAGRLEIARSNVDLDRILGEGKTAIVQTVEGGHVLGDGLQEGDVDGRLDRVDQLSQWGIASLTLAHLFPNELAGHTDGIPKEQHRILFWRLKPEVEPKRGLTELGKEVVERMVKRRIVPDVTHCTPAAREDVYDRVANRIPVIASHAGVQPMNSVPYNLNRDDAKAIADSKGVIGVIFMPYWLDRAHPKDGLEAVWRTMETLHDWTGSWENVAIGTDFDGFTDPPDDCSSAAELPAMRKALEEMNLAPADVEAILGGNARRVLNAGWK